MLLRLLRSFFSNTSPHGISFDVHKIDNCAYFLIDENEHRLWAAQEFINYRQRRKGCTALHLTILSNSTEAVDCLIDVAPDTFIKMFKQMSFPLHMLGFQSISCSSYDRCFMLFYNTREDVNGETPHAPTQV